MQKIAYYGTKINFEEFSIDETNSLSVRQETKKSIDETRGSYHSTIFLL